MGGDREVVSAKLFVVRCRIDIEKPPSKEGGLVMKLEYSCGCDEFDFEISVGGYGHYDLLDFGLGTATVSELDSISNGGEDSVNCTIRHE